MEEGVLKKLLTSIKCNICQQHYEADNIEVLGRKQGLWFLSAYCPVCQNRSLLAAVIKEDKVSEAVTDLTEAEIKKFKHVDKLTSDEVLDMHSFLKDFDGDFINLFNQK